MNLALHSLYAPPWWLALILSAVTAVISKLNRWLTLNGAVSAAIMGGLVYSIGGWPAISPILFFFLSCSILSSISRRKIQKPLDRNGRNGYQVLANGGVPLLFIFLHLYARIHWPLYKLPAIQLLFLSSIAAVNADTWGTEIGIISGQTPRSLRTWKPVNPGTSGAISAAGTLGSFLGALVIPLVMWPIWKLNAAEALLVTWAGFMGSGIDSILGAGLQASYSDSRTGSRSETPTSPDGKPNCLISGFRWMTNDVVNFLAGAGGAASAYLIIHYYASILFP